VGSNNNISQTLRGLFTVVKNAIAPTPEAELPQIRHQPLDQDSDTAFWSDMTYLHDLRKAIFEEIREGAFLWEMPLPVEGHLFWLEWDWPVDEAALLLDAWKYDLKDAA
jgi:hypothetical protein